MFCSRFAVWSVLGKAGTSGEVLQQYGADEGQERGVRANRSIVDAEDGTQHAAAIHGGPDCLSGVHPFRSGGLHPRTKRAEPQHQRAPDAEKDATHRCILLPRRCDF